MLSYYYTLATTFNIVLTSACCYLDQLVAAMKKTTITTITTIFPTFIVVLTVASISTVAAAASDLTSVLRRTTPTTIILVLTSFIVFLLQLHFETFKRRKCAVPLPPGPSTWPVLGNLPEIFFNRPAFRWILGFMKEMNTNIACVRLGDVHVIPVTCPEIAREFLKKQDSIFATRPITMGTEYSSRKFLSVAVAPWGEQWKKMRRVIASEVITPTRLRWLHDKRSEEADDLVRNIYNLCKSSKDGRIVDVRVSVRQYSANVIKKMMFNKRSFGEGNEDGEHVEALFTVLSLLYAFCVSDYMPCLRWLDLNGHERIMRKAISVVNKYHDPIIDGRIKEWRSGIKTEQEDLLDVLISLKDGHGKPLLTTEEIKAQSADLIYASVDNPSNAVEWALAEMINQPDILRKAVEELDRVVGKSRLVQEFDIPQLNYVKACAREAFRLHPIAPFNLPHVASCEATVAGYFIPKGSHILLSRTGLGRNPKVWDEPLRFKPERHLGSNDVDLAEPDLRFISFSVGRRGCMGALLGTAMTVMLLARLLQCFSWSLPPNVSEIDLSESENDLFLAKPLSALATPRLDEEVYPSNSQ